MSRKSRKSSPDNLEGVNLLHAFIGARKRNDESTTRAQRRLAADLDYSDSAIKRAVKNGVVSERLRDALLNQLDKESKYTKRTIYYGLRLMKNAKGKRLSDIRQQSVNDPGAFRGRVKKYRVKVQNQLTKRLMQIEREMSSYAGYEGFDDDIIFDTDVTPTA